MDRATAIHALSFYGPALLIILPAVFRPTGARQALGALLAFAWNVPTLLLLNILALRYGWWSFTTSTGTIAGVPADLLLGWAILWGAAPALLTPRLSIAVIVGVLVTVDMLLMPLATPVLHLGDRWLVGEGLGVAVALVPGLVFARLTVADRAVGVRATLQAITFAALLLWMLPLVVFDLAGGSWSHLLDNWRRLGGALLQLAALPALLGVSAVQEFATRGQGTPIPFDPPKRLVTSGPYAYVANPMQLSMALTIVAWGALLQNVWVVLAGPMAFIYSIGLATMDEHSDLEARFGDSWREYRRGVRAWLPRLRPHHAGAPARLYVGFGCKRCSPVARWFQSRNPIGLEIVPAEHHPTRDLTRITYEPGDGSRDEAGVVAIAHALEHIHFAWAMIGWFMRLPLMAPALQLLVDASGGQARLIPRTNVQDGLACPMPTVRM